MKSLLFFDERHRLLFASCVLQHNHIAVLAIPSINFLVFLTDFDQGCNFAILHELSLKNYDFGKN